MLRLDLAPHMRPGDTCSWLEWDKTDPRRGRPHAHQFREVFWVIAGDGVHDLNGLEYELRPGMLVLVHEDDCHDLRPTPGGHLRFVNLAFDLKTWRYLRHRYWRDRPDPFDCTDPDKLRCLDEARWNDLIRFSDDLQGGRRDRCALERFLLNLVCLLEPPGNSGEPSLPRWLYDALLQLQNPQVHRDGRKLFVDRCGRSREHVARECRKLLGKSPTELVNDARFRHAAELLARTDRRVLDIALESGFANLGYFYREFARRYGGTPRAYRLRRQQLIRPV